MEARSNKTQLADRTLWYDGDSTFDSQRIIELASQYELTNDVFVNEMTEEIKRYNQMVPVNEQLSVKPFCNELDVKWKIPDDYQSLDVVEHIFRLLHQEIETMSINDAEMRVKRTSCELKLYHKLGLLDVLRTLIYIINTLEEKQVVWGVGRGSSVSSYVLFLIGVHDVDSIEYDLNLNDFLRVPE